MLYQVVLSLEVGHFVPCLKAGLTNVAGIVERRREKGKELICFKNRELH